MNWSWIANNVGAIADAALDHVVLTGLAVGVGFTISLVFALLIHRNRRFYSPISGITGLLYTIPSLALFAILVPVTGLSLLTAEIGLVSYTLLILTRHIIAGLRVATVTTIGLVMVTALIGEGGLGQLMLRGFNFRNYTAVYVGAIVTVGLAVVADLALLTIGRLATPWTRPR
jgi:osmoprotectant transport system permease protein